MQVARQKEIRADGSQRSHRRLRAADEVSGPIPLGEIKRVMRHHDLRHGGIDGGESAHGLLHLPYVQTSASASHRHAPGAVDPDGNHFLVFEHRRELGGDVAAIAAQRIDNLFSDIEERDIVIAGHNQQWPPNAVEKRACLLKFARSSALCQVARNHHQIRRDFEDHREQRRDQVVIEPSEVQIRQVHNRPHGSIAWTEHVERERI